MNKIKLCSACLMGINCRFDGKNKINKEIIELAKEQILIPFCPEQLGGLSTPRESAEIIGNKVITKSGKDITNEFNRGAEEALKIARLLDIKEAFLKQKSPACGFGEIYDGTFSGKIIKGNGITANLLKRNNIKIIPFD